MNSYILDNYECYYFNFKQIWIIIAVIRWFSSSQKQVGPVLAYNNVRGTLFLYDLSCQAGTIRLWKYELLSDIQRQFKRPSGHLKSHLLEESQGILVTINIINPCGVLAIDHSIHTQSVLYISILLEKVTKDCRLGKQNGHPARSPSSKYDHLQELDGKA